MCFKISHFTGMSFTPEQLEEFAIDTQLKRLKRQPQITLERAIGHICRRDCREGAPLGDQLATGAAAQILSKLSSTVIREKREAAERAALEAERRRA